MPNPGWYPDPSNTQQQRWWDGRSWTGQTQHAGVPAFRPQEQGVTAPPHVAYPAAPPLGSARDATEHRPNASYLGAQPSGYAKAAPTSEAHAFAVLEPTRIGQPASNSGSFDSPTAAGGTNRNAPGAIPVPPGLAEESITGWSKPKKLVVFGTGAFIALLFAIGAAQALNVKPSLNTMAADALAATLDAQGLEPGNVTVSCPATTGEPSGVACTAKIANANTSVTVNVSGSGDQIVVTPARRLLSEKDIAASTGGKVTCKTPTSVFVAEAGATLTCTVNGAPAIFTIAEDGTFKR